MPRLCRVAVQKSFGNVGLGKMLAAGKLCTCCSAGVVGAWEHYLVEFVPWPAAHCPSKLQPGQPGTCRLATLGPWGCLS